MLCNHCGSQIDPSVRICPICGTPVMQETVYPTPQGQLFSAGVESTSASAPQYNASSRAESKRDLSDSLRQLPRLFKLCFLSPVDALRELVLQSDPLTGVLCFAAVLLLTFLAGLAFTRSAMHILYALVSSITHASLGSSAASMNQGMAYIAARTAPATAGVITLCRFVCMLASLGVYAAYLSIVCNVLFTRELFLGMLTLESMPAAAFLLIGTVGSLLSPWVTVIILFVELIFHAVHITGLFHALTGQPEERLFPGKALCVTICAIISALLCLLICSLLMGGIWQRMVVLVTNVGSLM